MGKTPLIYFPGKVPIRRRRESLPAGSPPEVLTLITATYDPVYAALQLTFDAPINTDAMVLAAIEVVDADSTGQTLRGFTTTGLSADSVTIELEPIGPATGTGVTLNVASGNGIVAASDGSEWGGVSGLVLPFE